MYSEEKEKNLIFNSFKSIRMKRIYAKMPKMHRNMRINQIYLDYWAHFWHFLIVNSFKWWESNLNIRIMRIIQMKRKESEWNEFQWPTLEVTKVLSLSTLVVTWPYCYLIDTTWQHWWWLVTTWTPLGDDFWTMSALLAIGDDLGTTWGYHRNNMGTDRHNLSTL